MDAAFPIVLFIIGAVLFGGTLRFGISLRSILPPIAAGVPSICPDNHEPVPVEVDDKFAFKTALRGNEHDRLQSCTRWPEKATAIKSALAQLILQKPRTSAAQVVPGARAARFAIVR